MRSVYLTFVNIFFKVLKKFSQPRTIVQNKGGLPEFPWSFTQVNFHLEMYDYKKIHLLNFFLRQMTLRNKCEA